MTTTTRTAKATAPKAQPIDFTFVLTKTKETKGAVRYDNAELGLNIYFRKDQLTVEGQKGYPESITMGATFNW